jgi:hypothetical protein
VPDRIEQYPYIVPITTRWMDNDVYGHVNNVTYYSYFDTAANHFLIHEGGLDIHAGPIVALVVESHCQYHQALWATAPSPTASACSAPTIPCPPRTATSYTCSWIGRPGDQCPFPRPCARPWRGSSRPRRTVDSGGRLARGPGGRLARGPGGRLARGSGGRLAHGSGGGSLTAPAAARSRGRPGDADQASFQ